MAATTVGVGTRRAGSGREATGVVGVSDIEGWARGLSVKCADIHRQCKRPVTGARTQGRLVSVIGDVSSPAPVSPFCAKSGSGRISCPAEVAGAHVDTLGLRGVMAASAERRSTERSPNASTENWRCTWSIDGECRVLHGSKRLTDSSTISPDDRRELFVSAKTVEHHVSSILAKLEVATRDEAVAKARRRGWLDPPRA